MSAVTAFMNLVQAQALLNVRKENVDFLRQQVRAAQDRLNVGEGTRTDVSQTNARLAAGQADYNAAVAALNSALAVYEQVVGHRPKSLGAAKPVDALLSKTLNAAIADAMTAHPGDPGGGLQHRHRHLQREGRGRLADAERQPVGHALPQRRFVVTGFMVKLGTRRWRG